ncbi:MAG: hypothetical protein M3680_27100 [Myxococcota bacterium]|nr:hypothetical protein [Myxococcota bacterium]
MTAPAVRVFTREGLGEIVAALEAELAAGASELALRVLDPDRGAGR